MRLLLIILGLGFIWFILHEDPKEYEPPVIQINRDSVVAYDWEKEREITQEMADTMIFSGGHWYSIKEFKKVRKSHHPSSKEPKWIRPSGKDRILRNSPAAERQWRLNQEKQEPLTEDDVRDIIRTEYER